MGKIPNDYIVLIHARIKTHGSISEKMFMGGTVMIGIFVTMAYYQSKIKETLQTVKRSSDICFCPHLEKQTLRKQTKVLMIWSILS